MNIQNYKLKNPFYETKKNKKIDLKNKNKRYLSDKRYRGNTVKLIKENSRKINKFNMSNKLTITCKILQVNHMKINTTPSNKVIEHHLF